VNPVGGWFGRLAAALRLPLSTPLPWRVEVQIHPGRARWRVRTFVLNRAPLTAWSIVILAYVACLTWAVAVAPSVVEGYLNRREYYTLEAERVRLGERLRALVGRMEQLAGRAADLNLRLEKVSLAYALPALSPSRARAVPATDRRAARSIYGSSIERGRRLSAGVRREVETAHRQLERLAEFEQAHPDAAASTPSICPLAGRDFVLLSPFGRRRHPLDPGRFELHTGLDLAARPGTVIRASAAGKVVFAGRSLLGRGGSWGRHGNLVILDHGGRFFTVYGRCAGLLVRKGQRVLQGDSLAVVAEFDQRAAPTLSAGPHLHYEVRRRVPRVGWQPVDPLIFMFDRRWPNEEQLLAAAQRAKPLRFDALPGGLER
jgi:murein DD-endopeptidase MepM/ murein hydrolase activator NlpD